jgi:hypothetical protein
MRSLPLILLASCATAPMPALAAPAPHNYAEAFVAAVSPGSQRFPIGDQGVLAILPAEGSVLVCEAGPAPERQTACHSLALVVGDKVAASWIPPKPAPQPVEPPKPQAVAAPQPEPAKAAKEQKKK